MEDIKVLLKRLVIPYFKGYVPYFLLALLGMVLSAAGASASAYLVKPVLDDIFVEKNLDALYLLPYAIILVYAMKGGGKYIQVYFSSLIGLDIIRKVRNRLLDKMLHLDMTFFHNLRSGELISRNINDVDRIRAVVSTMIPEIGRQTLTALGLLGVVIYMSPKLSFFALIVLPLIVFPLSRIAKKLKKLSHKSQEKTSDITARLSEIFSNIELIKAHASEKFEQEKFEKENHEFFKINLKAVKTSELSGPLMEVMGAIGVVVVIMTGGKEVIEGQMSVGSFFSFLTALFMLYTPIKRLSVLFNALQDAVAAGQRILYIFDQNPNIVSSKNKAVTALNTLHFEDVSLSYGEKQALKNINLHISKGEKLALVGDSGGGKSSLVNLIMRFYDNTTGEIRLDDTNIKDFSLESLRNSISIVTQRVYIFNDSIAANVAYGKEINEEKVIASLKQANAYEFVEEMGGIETKLNEHGANLSGGQRQRIAIARALYVDPQIMIFDEATSALDSKSEQKIIAALEEISKDKITITIAHRLSTIKNADKIAVFKAGEVICVNTEENLLKHCDEYKRLSGTFISE
ncbi:MAG: ATP-binding cassette domain-containing protein [Sulfurovum sp.]|nr:ATP-binding cassette domain-containing protein [Sulfurovum sp.]